MVLLGGGVVRGWSCSGVVLLGGGVVRGWSC